MAAASPNNAESQFLNLLLERVASRDQQAFAQLYDSTSRLVYGLVLCLLRDPSVAEEITMEVYMQIWRTAASYDTSRGSVSAWLVMVARSRSIDWLRSSKARFDRQKQTLEDLGELTDSHSTPETEMLASDRASVVRRALSALPPEQRKVIELAYFAGMSHTEMADLLSLPLGTIKSRVRVAMTRLKDLLHSYNQGKTA